MPKTIIAMKDDSLLLHDLATKTVTLAKKIDFAIPLMNARFFYDNADGSAVLSDFQSEFKEKGLAKIIADMVSDFLSGNKDRCKLFCYAGAYESEFVESTDYRSNNIDRLMLRETAKTVASEVKISSEIKIHHLDSKTVAGEYVSQMTTLLKTNTYWAADVDEKYTQNAINNSECFVAIDQQNKVVGFVRYISNGSVAYISDMVVDTTWRKQQVGTVLMQQACKLIDDQKHGFTALISAREGDGQVAAPKLYGDKFGFKDYSQGHQHNICFRYIRMTAENLAQYQRLSKLNNDSVADNKQSTNCYTLFHKVSNQNPVVMIGCGTKLHSGSVPYFGNIINTQERANSTSAYRR